MDEGIMGKGFDHAKLKGIIGVAAIAVFLIMAVSFGVSDARASLREFELFDQGYEYYLLYRPEKAVESFSAFLKDFPESSAKDAALFWLGKSLIQLRSFEKAKKIFMEIKQQFPESPYVPHLDREESEIFIKMAEEEKSRREKMKTKMADLERREEEDKALRAAFEEKRKKDTGGERGKSDDKAGGYETVAVRIKDTKFTLRQVIDFMILSSSVMNRLGVKEVPWRNGNLYEDFVNEQIIFAEAKRLNAKGDRAKQGELVEKYGFSGEEADYLDWFLAISDLIGRKIKDTPEEKVVESLTIRYTESDKQDKVLLSSELQEHAKRGKSFEEIQKLYPQAVRFSVVEFQELQGWIKERIDLLQDGEISVVWTKDGYMILRPIIRKPSYGPFEEVQPERRAEIKVFVRGWVEELRKGIREIEVVRSE